MVQNIVRFPAISADPSHPRQSKRAMNSVPTAFQAQRRNRGLRGAGATHDASSTDLGSMMSVLANRWPSIFALALTGLSLAALYLVTTPATYTASTTLLIDPRPKKIVSEDASQAGVGTDLALLESQVAIIRSDTVLGRVVTALNLTNDPEFAPTFGNGLGTKIKAMFGIKAEVPDPTTQALGNLGRALVVKRAQKTYVVDIEASSSSPEKAFKITKAIVDAYLADQSTAKAEEAQRANVLIDGRLGELREQVRIAETRRDEFRRTNKILNSEGGTVGEQQLTKLNTELITARAQLAEARARFDEVAVAARTGNPDSITDPAKTGLVQRLREQYAQVARREASLASQLLPRHPVLLDIRSQLNEVKSQITAELKRVGATAKGEFQIAESREREIMKALELAKTEVARTNTAQIKQRELDQEVAASSELMRLFLARSKETEEQQKVTTPDARVISPPSMPTRPSKPIPALILGLGLLSGLGLGLGRALMLDHLDVSLKSAGDIQRRTGLVTLGTVPELRPSANVRQWLGARRQPTAIDASSFQTAAQAVADTHDQSEFKYRQAVLRLLNRLRSEAAARGSNVVLLAGCDVEHGTSTTALAIAYAAALQGEKVLLIDASSNDTTLSDALAGPMPVGRAIVLDDPKDLSTIITRDPRSGLAFLPIALADLRILKTAQRQRLVVGLRALAQTYDFVMIDGGTVERDESASVILAAAGYVAVVARANAATCEPLLSTTQQLDRGQGDLPPVILTWANETFARA
jgi:polysaccharide biosynthesis transport protein